MATAPRHPPHAPPHPTSFDAVVVGGGVVGCAVLRELTLRGWTCLLLEQRTHLVAGASSGNTGIACTPSDVPQNTLEHECLQRACARNADTYRRLNLPHRPSGTVYCAFTNDEARSLTHDLAKTATDRGADVQLLSPAAVRQLEPGVNPAVKAGLWVKGEVVVDPWLVPIAWAKHAVENGARIATGHRLANAAFDHTNRRWNLDVLVPDTETKDDGQPLVLHAAVVVACGGLWGDLLEQLHRPSPFAVRPRRGDFVLYGEPPHRPPKATVPLGRVPTPITRGVYVWRSVHGVLACGPTAQPVDERHTPPAARPAPDVVANLHQAATHALPALAHAPLVGTYSGLRPGTELTDYRIEKVPGKSWVTVAGIRSTGLTASLGIGHFVADLCEAARTELGQPPARRPAHVSWTPLPPVRDIAASFQQRGDGTVVFAGAEAFGAHLVTHPLTREGFRRMHEATAPAPAKL